MSLRNAINAMCRHCIYDQKSPGNWRQQVEACTAPLCPLFEVRPRSKGMKRVEGLIANLAQENGQNDRFPDPRQTKAPAATEANEMTPVRGLKHDYSKPLRK